MPAQAEVAVYSVAELDRRLKRAIEGVSANVWVEGEVSSAKPAPSGHLYFCLKDEREDAVVECVMYRSSAWRARRLVVDGARVQLRGRATLWAPRGRLQFMADMARPAGRGALLEALENLKLRLLEEGLFAPARKRPIPAHPAVVGVVTSASGAAIHDIAKVAFRRGGVRILLSSTLVQGPTAASRVVDAIDRLERLPEVEVIIVGRGGGSADDLMVFNDEEVVRRVAGCTVPVISAVGHEVDVTLTDLAADARAATPSQAAEWVVADARAQRDQLVQARARLYRAMRSRLAEDRGALRALRTSFVHLRLQVAEREQKVDDLSQRLEQVQHRLVGRRHGELERLHRRLVSRHPRTVIASSRAALSPLQVRLVGAERALVESARGKMAQGISRLSALSPLAVLARGYAIASTEEGRAIRSAAEVVAGQTISIRVHEGRFAASVLRPEFEKAVPEAPESPSRSTGAPGPTRDRLQEETS
jgi:exodeoxyribonuclease VII large subunit